MFQKKLKRICEKKENKAYEFSVLAQAFMMLSIYLL
jgi:hypothetical protein